MIGRLFLFISAVTATASAEHFQLKVADFQENAVNSFKAWAAHHQRHVSDNAEEFSDQLQHWTENVQHLLNSRNDLILELNGLMHLSDDEFRQIYLGHSRRQVASEDAGYRPANLTYRYKWVQPAEHMDWRPENILGPIKNQHVNGTKCGCCWTFATTGVVEAISAMATGRTESVSEQQLIDCDRGAPFFDLGCQGGDFFGGMKYIIDNGGIALESEYPYLAKDEQCRPKTERRDKAVTIDAYEAVPVGNETALMQAVTMHPVAIGLCVGDWIKEWKAYTGGILKVPENCEDPQDHALVVVGYGEENGEKYWLIQNSWSLSWGEEGFLKLPRFFGTKNGYLGLAANPGYPVKISPNPHHAQPSEKPDSLQSRLMDMGRRAFSGFAQ